MAILPIQDSLIQPISDTLDTLGLDRTNRFQLVDTVSQIVFNEKDSFLVQHKAGDWTFIFLLSLFMGYAISRAILGRLLSSTFLAAVRYNTAASMLKDNSQLQRQRDLVLILFYFLSTALFLLLLSQKFDAFPYDLNGPILLAFYAGLLAVIFYGRMLLLNILGHIFYNTAMFRAYLYMGHAQNKLLGIVMLPVNLVLLYSKGMMLEIAWITTLILLILLLLLKIFRGFEFALKHNVLNIYLFLYLCALEIVPILLFYKWFETIL